MRNLIYLFLLRFHEIFYYTGRFDERCLSCGTISNGVCCYDVGSSCDFDFWDLACWKVGAKMKSVKQSIHTMVRAESEFYLGIVVYCIIM